ncbi:hypothetical protein H5079_04360 [Pseudoalteromonas sp. SG44-5]|uniref:hypothetical protein n=1 Tax=Pseudoalteromonas sp. SG44-5 TaxID=2760960 RepID=UPI0015FB5E74|nr:hypothetical protein [Pseudoalteromonas sp. SG44-5]MBB1404842.1 hypothetical protein [Pseudoalteromonas sp. SG44-5]
MAAFTASQASVTNGSKVVTINSGESIANVRQGDFLFLAGFLVEINRGYVGAASQQYIELVKNWANSNQSSQPAVVIPTTGDFRAAVDAINNANKNVNDNFVAMQNWQTNMGSVTFTNQDGTTTTVKTLKQIESEAQTQLDTYHPHPWAMRKVEFEANRAQNNEKFAASGFVHFGKHRENGNTMEGVGSGLFIRNNIPNILGLGLSENFALTSADVKGDSPTRAAYINFNGVLVRVDAKRSTAENSGITIKFPPPEDGTRTVDLATGLSVIHATAAIAFASETDTNKVVTERFDLWGFEAFLREISDEDPFVYSCGMIQSGATQINGVYTKANISKPASFFAWYEGDSDSQGWGVNWQTASEGQRIAIASDPENNIYFNDVTGKFYQWSIRGRSIAGLGNGNWSKGGFQSNFSASQLQFGGAAQTRIRAQGASDSDVAYSVGEPYTNAKGSYEKYQPNITDRGCYLLRKLEANDNKAVNGEGFFLVCGMVSRLNRGGYHPSFNPLGSAWLKNDGSRVLWDSSQVIKPSNKAELFNSHSAVASTTTAGYSNLTGLVEHLLSGRPDGRYCDVIYSGGAGGICQDMRYLASGVSTTDFADADLKVKSSNSRGFEYLKVTKIAPLSGPTTASGVEPQLRAYSGTVFNLGIDRDNAVYYTYNLDTQEIFDVREYPQLHNIQSTTKGHVYYPATWGVNPNAVIIYQLDTDIPIAGEFNQTDVIGRPENILQCEDLKGGWVGNWLPDLPTGEAKEFRYSRKNLLAQHSWVGTDDLGLSWTPQESLAITSASNRYTHNAPETRIGVINYKAKAKCTRHSDNMPVLGSSSGLGTAWVSQSSHAHSLPYSLIGLIPIWAGGFNYNKAYPLNVVTIDHDRRIQPHTNRRIVHGAIEGLSPTFPRVVKVLDYQTEENGMAWLVYTYVEIKYDGTSWGDDNEFYPTNKQSSILDTNGNDVLAGTAIVVEPLGWIKNDK